MASKNRYGYNNYRGGKYRRGRGGRILLIVLALAAVALIVAAVLHATGNIEYTAEGPVLGFLNREPKESPPPSATPVLVIEDENGEETTATPPSATPAPTPTPTPEPTPEPGVARPDTIRAVYLPDVNDSAAVEGTVGLARAGLINAVVLELKHDNGSLEFISAQEYAIGAEANPASSSVGELCQRLHSEGLYVMAGMNAFEDSLVSNTYRDLSVATSNGVRWLDWQYHGWLDPYSEDAKAYLTALAKEMVALGADEILLDKFAFPTRGRPQLLYFPEEKELSRIDVLSDYAAALREELLAVGADLSFRYDVTWRDVVVASSGVDVARMGGVGEIFYLAQLPNDGESSFSCAMTVRYSDANAGAAVRRMDDAAGAGLIITSADGRYPASW